MDDHTINAGDRVSITFTVRRKWWKFWLPKARKVQRDVVVSSVTR